MDASSGSPTGLLERHDELALLAACVAGRRGRGGEVVIVRGAAGIGKSALLAAVHDLAATAGVRTLHARGGPFEQGYSFGVVRQLLEPVLRRSEPADRERYLGGAAGLARPLVADDRRGRRAPGDEAWRGVEDRRRRAGAPEPEPTPGASVRDEATDEPTVADADDDDQVTSDGQAGGGGPDGGDGFRTLHGLYWLCANLADDGPVVVIVDDAHWCDASSLRFLLFLATRLADLELTIVLGVRHIAGERWSPLLGELAVSPATIIVAPSPLSAAAVGALVEGALGGPPAGAFVDGCHTATGGNPFLTTALLRALAASDVRPTAEAAGSVPTFGPDAVSEHVRQQLVDDPDALQLAEAAAVLGDDATLARCAALADVDLETASMAAALLVDRRLADGGWPLTFVHPIVRAAVYGQRPRVWLDAAHIRAAQLLLADDEPPSRVATHVLASDELGWPDAVGVLVDAADSASETGAHEDAGRLLRRALREPLPAPRRADLLLRLGAALAAGRDPDAAPTLAEGLALDPDPDTRTRLALILTDLLIGEGRWREAAATIDATLEHIGVVAHEADETNGTADAGDALRLQLRTFRLGFSGYDPSLVGDCERLMDELRAPIATRAPGWRAAAAVCFGVSTSRLMPSPLGATDETELIDGFDRLLAEVGLESPIIGQVCLGILDAVDDLAVLGNQLLDLARRRGSVNGTVVGATFTGYARTLAGDLAGAEADIRFAFELALGHGVLFPIPSMLFWVGDFIIERPANADLAAFAFDLELDPGFVDTVSGVLVQHARARLLARDGRAAEAVAAFRSVGAHVTRGGWRHPVLYPWRVDLAEALAPTDPDEACALATEHLAIAEQAGSERATAAGLRVLGRAIGGDGGVAHLVHSVEVARRSTARLEEARCLLQLGATLRRANRRAAAREPLQAAVDLAQRCGATRTVELASAELRATGARPRRTAVSGPESLTPSQRRVAQHAADGLTNPEIAQALFVTRNTVESHLRSVYTKLGISSRDALPAALGAGADAPGAATV